MLGQDANVVELRTSLDQTKLVQSEAFAEANGEGARDDFEEEWALVARLDLVKVLSVVGDDAGEDVEAPDGTARVSLG